jgi:hypothetical protein
MALHRLGGGCAGKSPAGSSWKEAALEIPVARTLARSSSRGTLRGTSGFLTNHAFG